MVTRVLQTSVIALFPSQSTQAVVVSLLVLIDIFLIRELMPYSINSDNEVAALSKGVVFVWAQCVLAKIAGAFKHVHTVVVGVVLLSSVVAVVARAVQLTLKDGRSQAEAEAQEQDTSEQRNANVIAAEEEESESFSRTDMSMVQVEVTTQCDDKANVVEYPATKAVEDSIPWSLFSAPLCGA